MKIYELGIDSQTPPEIAQLLLFFQESGMEARGDVLSLLVSQNRFELVFDLLKQVSDSEKQHELYSLAFGLNDTLLRLARENQWEDIRYLLSHPLTFKHDSIPCAYFHLVNGTLDELITRLETELTIRRQDGAAIDDQDHLTLASLLRIQRRYDEAYVQAEEIEDLVLQRKLVRQILLEKGDWRSLAERMVLSEENSRPAEGKLVFTLPQQVLIHHFLDREDEVQTRLAQLIQKTGASSGTVPAGETDGSFRLLTQLALAVADWPTTFICLNKANRLEAFELLSYLNRPEDAFQSAEIGNSFDERVVWTRRRIRNMQSLQRKILRLEENDLDSEAVDEDLTKTWKLCCRMVRQLGGFGFREEALFHYRELFDAIGEGRTTWERRGDIIEGLMSLGEYEEVWKLIERGVPESDLNQLLIFLFPFKRTSAEFWNNQLSKRYPVGLTRLKKIAGLVNSPLSGAEFDQC